MLTQAVKVAYREKRQLFGAFLDINKACDSVDRHILLCITEAVRAGEAMGGFDREDVWWSKTGGLVAGEHGRASDNNRGFKAKMPVVITPLHAVHLEHGKGFGGEWLGFQTPIHGGWTAERRQRAWAVLCG